MFRLVLWLFILLILAAATCICLVFVYEKEVKSAIVKELNKNLNAEVKIDPANIDLTILKTFPKCALEFKDVLILEALNKKKRDTLIYAGNIAMLFNVKDLINKHYNIQKIKVNAAICHLSVSKKGEPNYLFWKKSAAETTGDSLNFSLENIELNDIRVQYRNYKEKLKTAAHFDHAEFSGNFKENSYEMTSAGKGRLAYLQLNKTALLSDKAIRYEFDVNINADDYAINTAELAINEMFFAVSGNLRIHDSLQSATLGFTGKKLDIAAVLSLLPEKHAARINDYSSEGEFFTNGTISYKAGSPADVKAEFGIRNATVTYKPKSTKLERLNLNGKLAVSEKESYLNLQNISAALGSNSFNGFCLITNLQDPYLNLSAGMDTRLEELNAFWPIDTLEHISGALQLQVAIKGKLKEMQQSAFSPNIEASGHATLKDIKTRLKGSTSEINISEGSFVLEDRNVNVNDFKILVGASDLRLTGSLPEFLNYLFDSKKPFTINAALKSNSLALEDLLYSSGSNASQKVNIPANLVFNIHADIAKLSFSRFEATDVKGAVEVQDQKIVVKELALNAMDGQAALNAYADASGDNIRITATASLKNINISKLFYQCNNFGQSTLNDKHLKGFATTDIEFSGSWSKELKADLKSISATSNVLIERGELMNFKPLESLSKYVELQELRDIKFSSLQSTIDIKDQVIIIPKTSIKNSALNIELWGRHTFSNEIEYHLQLLLSELLAHRKRANKELDEELSLVENDPENRRSVFISMTGTVDNPVIRYDKKGLRQKIGSDIKAEKQNLKQLLKEEFGLFKKDSTLKKTQELKADQKFKIEFGDKPSQPKKDLQPKKQEEDDDF